MKIKIKVKHLIIMIICIFTAIYLVLPNALFMYAKAMENEDVEASKSFYQKYADLFPYGSRRAEALYELGMQILPDEALNSMYKIYASGSSSWGTVVTPEIIDNAAKCYTEILDNHKDSEFYIKAYNRLITIYTSAGKFSNAKELIDEGLKSTDEDIRFIASKHNMHYLLALKEYDKALSIGYEYVSNGRFDIDIYMMMGDMYFYQGEYENALNIYNKARDIFSVIKKDNEKKYEMLYSDVSTPYDRIQILQKIMNGYNGNGRIYGSVVINGEPQPFVNIYLKDAKDGNLDSTGDEQRCITAVTGFDGYYELPNLPDGSYTVAMGIPSSRLDNTAFEVPEESYISIENGLSKECNFIFSPPLRMTMPTGNITPVDNNVEVQWEKVDGAAYYLVRIVEFTDPGQLGGSYCAFSPSDKILDTKYTINIDRVNADVKGFVAEEDGMINPQAYIGTFYPGAKVPIYVEAFDRYGRSIKKSVPIKINASDMALIIIPSKDLTDGDNLVMQKKPDEAIKCYEKVLAETPNDMHSLLVLSKIYSLGTKRQYIDGKPEVSGKDIEKAKGYLQRLYELTGDVFYKKAMLGRDYVEPGDYEEAIRQYELLPEDGLDAEDFAWLAQMNLSVENYTEADRYYEKLYELNKDTNYYDLAPVVLRMYKEDYAGSLKFLNILDLRPYKVHKDTISNDIQKLKAMDKGTDDYKEFLNALKLVLSSQDEDGFNDEFTKIYNNMSNPILSELLKEIGNYYYAFERY